MNRYWVYIVSNKYMSTIYTGVTNDIVRRVWEHRSGNIRGFT
ncbi:MAG: GIY-YIG nuclease family protein, partial [Alistipes sp.]|nr:GIY-YIG nuclease family protein [Alistipes sp.]